MREAGEFALFATSVTLFWDIPWKHIEDQAWPDLSKEVQEGFERIAENCRPNVKLLEPPPIEQLATWTPRGDLLLKRNKMANHVLTTYLHQSEALYCKYNVIAVPKYIRDPQHRKDVLVFVKQQLAQPKLGKGQLGPRGGMLGTEQAWDNYLLDEQLRQERFRREKDRVHLVVLMLYASDARPPRWEIDGIKVLPSNMGKLWEIDRVTSAKRAPRVRAHIAEIERAIGAAYPRPFIEG